MNKKGFTLVELLAVIAILAILVIIALPNVLNMFNQAKKDTFLTEAKTIYKEVTKKYITENMKGNKVNNISNSNNKLDLDSNNLDYNIKLDSKGNIKNFQVSNDTYCLSGKFKNLNELTVDKITEGKCQKVEKSFKNDSWETIVDNVRDFDIEGYNVGDTKEIDLGEYGTHTVRIANTSTPSECSTEGFSQTACGFVIEFADIITFDSMNRTNTNVGGWPSSRMYTLVNDNIYNAIPSEIRNIIIDTTVISGHGSKNGEENFISTDKLYLLTQKEIYMDFSSNSDSAKDLTRTLDYYIKKETTTTNYSGAIKKKGAGDNWWWLRSARSTGSTDFNIIYNNGNWNVSVNAGSSSIGISPAFRIG